MKYPLKATLEDDVLHRNKPSVLMLRSLSSSCKRAWDAPLSDDHVLDGLPRSGHLHAVGPERCGLHTYPTRAALAAEGPASRPT